MSITKIIADHPVYTCVMVFDKKVTKTLFCIRTKEPFKGKYNFNGGKVDKDEEPLANAYREIEEETGITSEDIKLKLLMTFEFNLDNIKMYAFAGILNKEVELKKELNDLE
jgi:8-oxo-dGTP diphosphatase